MYTYNEVEEDQENASKVIIVINVAGGLVQDVGVLRRDTDRVHIIVIDEDCQKVDIESSGIWSQEPSAIEDWPKETFESVVSELPEWVRQELNI